MYARHVEDPGPAGGVNLWGASPLYICPVTMKGYHLYYCSYVTWAKSVNRPLHFSLQSIDAKADVVGAEGLIPPATRLGVFMNVQF